VNLKAFFVAALSSALDLGIAVPDDVIRHVTPDVLATHLPRPLWARLLTACLGASRVDALLVVETVGVPNLCEHIPVHIIWGCIQEIGARSLSGVVMAAAVGTTTSRPIATQPAQISRPIPLATPPPPLAAEPRVAATSQTGSLGPSIPAPTDNESDPASRTRIPAAQRFRQSNSGIGRLAATPSVSARRPQAQATPPSPPSAMEPIDRTGSLPRIKRGQTEAEIEVETFVSSRDDHAIAVEDEQLVDWSASDETVSNSDLFGRKR
jgi:hypothetical protein